MAGFYDTPDICQLVQVEYPPDYVFVEWQECDFTDLFAALDEVEDFAAEVEPEAYAIAAPVASVAAYRPSLGDRLTPNTDAPSFGGGFTPSFGGDGPTWIITPPTHTHGEIPTMPTTEMPMPAPVPLPESGALLALALMLAWLAVNMKGRSA